MPLFEVMVPGDAADPLATEIVGQRFSWSAALLPPLWALTHGLWLDSLLWLAGLAAIVAAGLFVGSEAAFWLYLLFAAWFGFSAADLRLGALRRAGYRHAATRIAGDEVLAERDWIAERRP